MPKADAQSTAPVQVRLSAGPLHGKTLWVDGGCTSVNVHMGARASGGARTALYQKGDSMFEFVSECNTPPPM